MRTFTLKIECENDAFTETLEGCRAEVARILRRTAQRLVEGADAAPVTDFNGNRIGRYKLTTS